MREFSGPGRNSMTSLHFGWVMDRSKIEKISKALADETRLRIFEEISARDRMSCGEIVSLHGVTPATVSHHLRILSEAGLIICHRKGQFVFSYIVPETVAEYTQAVAKIAGLKNVSAAAKSRRRPPPSRFGPQK